jgi:hypothetical protein
MRAKEFTNVLYETTEIVVNVPIRIRLDQLDDSEETTVPLEPRPIARVTVVKKIANGEVHDEPEMPVPFIPEIEDEAVDMVVPPAVSLPPKPMMKKSTMAPRDPSKPDPNPVFVSPLQQEIELKKAEVGKESPIIGKLTQDETKPIPRRS